MQHILMTVLLLVGVVGCAQPQVEQPRAKGSYLLIENGQAWAVLVADGKRVEERGTVIDAIRPAGEDSAIADSYVIDTSNCGRVQWLIERRGVAEGATTRMALRDSGRLAQSHCTIGTGLGSVWTVLDYSG